MTERRRRAAAVLALGAGLLAAAVTAGGGPYLRADRKVVVRPFRLGDRIDLSALFSGSSTKELPSGLRRAGDIVEVVLVVVVSLVLVLLAAAVVAVVLRGLARIRLLRLARASAAEDVDPRDLGELVDDEATEPLRRRLARQIDVGVEALDDVDPREVVIACYLAMVETAAAAGTARRPHETSTELLERVLAERGVPAQALERLTALYREVRYSAHPVDDAMRAEARAALAAARAALSGELTTAGR
ncbi:MAG TPA: DUF4129 domain-containing protein [Mycobacteriales bacterium]|nr:DUF4129 domain-containing protein [Mycobacteriales bacterium]